MTTRASDLRRALEELRSTGRISPVVRPEIAASWHRSMVSAVNPDRPELPYVRDPHADDRLERAALPVMNGLAEDLESASMGLLLTDPHGVIVDRRVEERSMRARLDRVCAMPGFTMEERLAGTNAIGTALEQRVPFMVRGSEHFADVFTRLACAAAPIVDPTTSLVVGSVDLTSSVEASHTLMLALARRTARDIEQRLLSANPAADRSLLEAFLHARRGARGALVALNQRALYTNAPAARLMQDIDRTMLWDLASSALSSRQHAELVLPLPRGGSSYVTCEKVTDGGDVAGALPRFVSEPVAAARLLVPERRRPRTGWDSLTGTERIIADLVSQGRTNREIAATTFLSPHTVGYHLRHIFSKLGVTSRVELTRLVVQRGRENG